MNQETLLRAQNLQKEIKKAKEGIHIFKSLTTDGNPKSPLSALGRRIIVVENLIDKETLSVFNDIILHKAEQKLATLQKEFDEL